MNFLKEITVLNKEGNDMPMVMRSSMLVFGNQRWVVVKAKRYGADASDFFVFEMGVTLARSDKAVLRKAYKLNETTGVHDEGAVYIAKELVRQEDKDIKRECRNLYEVGKYSSLVDHNTMDRPIIISDYYPGVNLWDSTDKKIHKRVRRLPFSQRVKLIVDIAQEYNTIHQKDLVHKDTKADNIIVNLQGDDAPTAHVVDFGSALKLAELTSNTLEGMSLESLPPEIITSDMEIKKNVKIDQPTGEITKKTDIYALTEIFRGLLDVSVDAAPYTLRLGLMKEDKIRLGKLCEAQKAEDEFYKARDFLTLQPSDPEFMVNVPSVDECQFITHLNSAEYHYAPNDATVLKMVNTENKAYVLFNDQLLYVNAIRHEVTGRQVLKPRVFRRHAENILRLQNKALNDTEINDCTDITPGFGLDTAEVYREIKPCISEFLRRMHDIIPEKRPDVEKVHEFFQHLHAIADAVEQAKKDKEGMAQLQRKVQVSWLQLQLIVAEKDKAKIRVDSASFEKDLHDNFSCFDFSTLMAHGSSNYHCLRRISAETVSFENATENDFLAIKTPTVARKLSQALQAKVSDSSLVEQEAFLRTCSEQFKKQFYNKITFNKDHKNLLAIIEALPNWVLAGAMMGVTRSNLNVQQVLSLSKIEKDTMITLLKYFPNNKYLMSVKKVKGVYSEDYKCFLDTFTDDSTRDLSGLTSADLFAELTAHREFVGHVEQYIDKEIFQNIEHALLNVMRRVLISCEPIATLRGSGMFGRKNKQGDIRSINLIINCISKDDYRSFNDVETFERDLDKVKSILNSENEQLVLLMNTLINKQKVTYTAEQAAFCSIQ
jgi:serine/threonine protein kinase